MHMELRKPRWLSLLIFSLTLGLPLLAHAQSADEAAVREVTERFFAAFKEKDAAALITLWSTESPETARNAQAFQELFSRIGKIELAGLSIQRMTTTDRDSTVRVIVDINAFDAK